MQILEMFFFMSCMLAIVMGVEFSIVKMTVTPQKVQEKKMDKMDEFFKNDRKIIKDLDYFFAEQWKPYSQAVDRHWASITMVYILIILVIGILEYFSNDESNMKSGVICLWIAGIGFFVLCVCSVLRLLCKPRFDKAFSRAKEKFREAYPSYIDQRLSREIVKADKDRLEMLALFCEMQVMWFCSDFLLYCSMLGYRFTFIRFADIENLEIRKYKTNSYNFAQELEYSFYIHYKVNGKEKKLYLAQVSVHDILEEFKKRNIEIIWKGDGFKKGDGKP